MGTTAEGLEEGGQRVNGSACFEEDCESRKKESGVVSNVYIHVSGQASNKWFRNFVVEATRQCFSN